jgi:uncharacterized membrane protein YhhN
VTGAAWALLAVAGVACAGNWVSRARDDRRLEVWTKPAATLLLLAVVLAVDPTDPVQRAWFAAALALSLVGDVALLVERFEAGLVAFLLAHVAFIAGFWVRGVDPLRFGVAAVVVLVVATPVARRIIGGLRDSGDGALVAPVVVYMAAICAMVASAAGTGIAVGIAGAAVFLVSDSVLAWNRFVQPMPWAPVAIMVTYHLGLVGLVQSLVA